jgi:hypothetical protein
MSSTRYERVSQFGFVISLALGSTTTTAATTMATLDNYGIGRLRIC